MVEHNNSNYDNVYKFNGKELDPQTGYYYYGARYYDPTMSIFLSVDPLAEDFPGWTPYHYVHNNPINMVDPTGMSANPVYGKDGDFLGTDDKGLQGKAIVIDKKNFEQGMAHEEALSYNLGQSGFDNEEAKAKMSSHYNGLKDRPDYDGFLTLSEANDWYRNGNGEPLYVDSAKISLIPQYKEDFEVGQSKYVNFASPSNANLETGLVYGTIKLTLLDNEGTTKLGGKGNKLDTYDFDYKKGRTRRNVATFLGEVVAGKGKGYDIYTYGNTKLGNKPQKAPAKSKFDRGSKF